MRYLKITLATFFAAFITLPIFSQDTTGQYFGFGYPKGKTFTYMMVEQDVVRNANEFPLQETIDSFYGHLTIESSDRLGYVVDFKFSAIDKSPLTDPLMKIPLKIALDSNGNMLELLNWSAYQQVVYKELDKAFNNGEIDSSTVMQGKFQFRNKDIVKKQISSNYEEFFAIFGRQLKNGQTYLVGKEIPYPFSNEPFIAEGSTTVKRKSSISDVYNIKTKIGNTERERLILMTAYENYLIEKGMYNPNALTPGIDIIYVAEFDFDTKLNFIRYFYLENSLRVGDESRTVSVSFRYLF